jgi:hypothetical protein
MVVPHYVYLKLKMPGNNGTNITVHGSFSRSDNCDREFQRIAAKFVMKQEVIDYPSKQLTSPEDDKVKKSKKKPNDTTLGVSVVGSSKMDDKASAKDINTLALIASTPDEIIDTPKVTGPVHKTQDKKNHPLV